VRDDDAAGSPELQRKAFEQRLDDQKARITEITGAGRMTGLKTCTRVPGTITGGHWQREAERGATIAARHQELSSAQPVH